MENQKISELKGLKTANTEGEIIRLDPSKEVITKFGKKTTTQNLVIRDDSGEIELSLWGEQCNLFRKGDRIGITNGYVSEYKGKLQLSTGKFGKIEKLSIESEPMSYAICKCNHPKENHFNMDGQCSQKWLANGDEWICNCESYMPRQPRNPLDCAAAKR